MREANSAWEETRAQYVMQGDAAHEATLSKTNRHSDKLRMRSRQRGKGGLHKRRGEKFVRRPTFTGHFGRRLHARMVNTTLISL